MTWYDTRRCIYLRLKEDNKPAYSSEYCEDVKQRWRYVSKKVSK